MRIIYVFLFLATLSRALGQTEVRPMKPVGDFTLKTLDGAAVSSTNYAGKTRLVLLWMSADKPSQRQIPVLVELQRDFGADLAVLGVSLEQNVTALKEFAATNSVNFPLFLADYAAVQSLGGVEAVPTLIVIEPHGIIMNRYVGFTEKATLKSLVQSILNMPR